MALTLVVAFLSAGCVFPFESLGLIPENETTANAVLQIQLSPPAKILPDESHSLDDAQNLQLAGEGNLDAAPSVTPFLPLDPSASATVTNTPSEGPSPTTTRTTLSPSFTLTPSVSPAVTWTATFTPTLPPGTRPLTPTPTATRTATANPIFSPTNTNITSPTDTQQAPTSPPPPTLTNTPAPTVPVSCDPAGNGSFESSLTGLINQERQNRGLGTLSTQGQLTTVARNHSADMACNSFFSHTGSDGFFPWDRATSLGYNYSAIAENIFAGSSNAQTAFDAWMNSPGHRDNMLNPTYTEIGLGYRYWAESPYGAYTTAVFARPR